MNDLRREHELKEKELEDTKTKAQDSEHQNQIANEELREELEKVKKEHRKIRLANSVYLSTRMVLK